MFKYAFHSRWSNFREKCSEDLAEAQPPRDSLRDRAGTQTATSTLLQHEPPKHKRQDRTTSRRPETPIKLLWKKCQLKIIQAPDCMDLVNLAHVHLKELLEAIQDGSHILDPTPETATECSLNQLNYKDFPALHRATASLSVKSKDKKLDVFFKAQITAMVGTLSLYLDSELSYTWQEASMIVARS
ncbi:hypothetical protein DFH07DRAFT_767684 [Mycena maculata]|uniref:Uncharacterized protein n=1 Tax=Mycena maculata TaxID=230809 RepID=A0AAD7NSX4_9AGAR|nr:hypothetical protein DFH07DRAFT_767684 [Mycena maculata]